VFIYHNPNRCLQAWEVDTMRGHTNNVSCVVFHPKQELIISNSEDRSIRVWDISKRLVVQTFRRDSDRFWILAAHPEQNLLAAGHDSGMIIFKLERERPPFDVVGGKCFYVKDRYLRLYDYSNNRDTPLVSLRRTANAPTAGTGGGPKTLSVNIFNKAEHNVLITSDADGGSYELLTFTEGSGSGEAQDVRRGNAIGAVFIARDRFLVLEKFSRNLVFRNFQNEVVKRIRPPSATVDGLFFGGTNGRVILKTEDSVILYDSQSRKVLAELQATRVKYVVWNKDYSAIALLSKNQIILASKQLEQYCIISEGVRLKGGAWDNAKPIFIYTTVNHVKYALYNGDKGILRGIESPVYATKIVGSTLLCLDREGKMRTLEIDITEALFKLALERKDYPEVLRMVKHSRLCGKAILTYLQEKGYPEVALHFVNDNKTRFKLALACGNIQVAMTVAQDLGDDAWKQLGIEALRQGNHEVVEMSYQKTKDFERLSFLYLITGNTEKLRKMLKIAEMRGDVMSRFHNALYLGDAEERVRVLESTNNLSLAYLAAATHGLDAETNKYLEWLTSSNTPVPKVNQNAALLQPPTPIFRGENWPLLSVGKPALIDIYNSSSASGVAAIGEDDGVGDGAEGNKWGDDEVWSDDEDGQAKAASKAKASASDTKAEKEGKGWGDDDDLDLSDEDEGHTADKTGTPKAADGGFVPPSAGQSPSTAWVADSPHVADHFAAGSVDSALPLLNRQIAAVNFAIFKQLASNIMLGAGGYLPGIPSSPPNRSFLYREANAKSASGKLLPSVCIRVPPLLELLKQSYKHFTNAQFQECRDSLLEILHSIPLVPAASRAESNDIKELLDVSREYITAVRVKLAIADAGEDIIRGLELAAYFTHCNLQPAHLLLALKTAMANAFKNKVTARSYMYLPIATSLIDC
jgi:coatomer subunit alpha